MGSFTYAPIMNKEFCAICETCKEISCLSELNYDMDTSHLAYVIVKKTLHLCLDVVYTTKWLCFSLRPHWTPRQDKA
jgi:hypothetical protein